MIGMGGATKSMEAGPPLFIYADSPAIAPHPGDTCPGTPALWPNTRQVHESAPSFVLSLSPCQMQVRYLYRARAPLLRAASLTFHRGQDARVQTTPFDPFLEMKNGANEHECWGEPSGSCASAARGSLRLGNDHDRVYWRSPCTRSGGDGRRQRCGAGVSCCRQ